VRPLAHEGDVEVRFCRICRRDMLHENTGMCLDGTDFLCTGCGSHEVVPTVWATYSSRPPLRIISGGQTGADRGGLNAAIDLELPHGGWCPKGRLAEDGAVPERYQLSETETASYPERTRRNVLEADATVIFTRGRLEGGSRLTAEIAEAAGKPALHVDLTRPHAALIDEFRVWLDGHQVATLNVAGSRESKAPGITNAVGRFLKEALAS